MKRKTFIVSMIQPKNARDERAIWLLRELKTMNLACSEDMMMPASTETMYTVYSFEQLITILTDEMLKG
jgi:hypothetical protein